MRGKSSAGAQYDLAQMVLAIYTGSFANPGGRGRGKQSGYTFTSCSHDSLTCSSKATNWIWQTVPPVVISGQRPINFRHPLTRSQSSFLARSTKAYHSAEEEENDGLTAKEQ